MSGCPGGSSRNQNTTVPRYTSFKSSLHPTLCSRFPKQPSRLCWPHPAHSSHHTHWLIAGLFVSPGYHYPRAFTASCLKLSSPFSVCCLALSLSSTNCMLSV